MHRFFVFILLLCCGVAAIAQRSEERMLTVGVQFKPIIPSRTFRTGPETYSNQGIRYTIGQTPGYAAGMLVRRNFGKRFSWETGINYVQRNFSLSLTDSVQSFSCGDDFRIIGYEVPATGMLYVQLGKQWYMNMAVGMSINLFPSDVATFDTCYDHLSIRRKNNWLQIGSLLNLGWEYRTEESGSWYIGGTFHRPIQPIYRSKFEYLPGSDLNEVIVDQRGNYLTIDLRYYFHEDPEKRESRKSKKKKRTDKKEDRPAWVK